MDVLAKMYGNVLFWVVSQGMNPKMSGIVILEVNLFYTLKCHDHDMT